MTHVTQRGAALITALVIAALTTAAAVSMAARSQIEVSRVANQIGAAREAAVAAVVEADVRAALREDAETSGHDAADETWAEEPFVAALGDFTATATLRDSQRLFNLNNLARTARNTGSRTRGRGAERATGAETLEPGVEAATPDTRTGSGRASARDDARPGSATDAATLPDDDGPAGVPATSEPGAAARQNAEPELVERTRFVLDESTSTRVRGRGRPSDLAQRVDPGAQRIAQTVLEPAAVDPSGEVGVPVPSAGFDETEDEPFVPDAEATASQWPGPSSMGSDGVPVSPATPDGVAAATAPPGVADPEATGAGGPPSSPHDLWVARFAVLLNVLDIDESVLQSILDWMDADSEERFPNGAEDAYYQDLETPYRAANGAARRRQRAAADPRRHPRDLCASRAACHGFTGVD